MLLMGFSPQKAVGASFLGILIISVSALLAHNKMANVDYLTGLMLGVGGAAGAQIGARLLQGVSPAVFHKILAGVLFGLAVYIFFKK